ncbi:MAG: flotillin family protein [Armatimonadetes bacterium]|nr:flotillin family protein [Armatimonadota bacterium]
MPDPPGFSPALWVVVGTSAVVLLLLFFSFMKSLLQLCPPNEVLILSGRNHRFPDGSLRGYRVLLGGFTFRWPIVEKVYRMSLGLLEVPISIRGAYSQGGVALNVDAIANVKISSSERVIGNAIERFLGRDPNEIRRVAKETLEGHLRGVLARLTPEQVNEDRLRFAEELASESEQDLVKLGIHLDTLKILHVSDDQHYLDSIGRGAIANIIREAEIAESDAERDAELSEADNQARANVTKNQVEAQIFQMKNELRRIQADLESTVKSEEERMLAAARQARAKAEQELQKLRAELEGIRLQVDTVLPAEAQQVAQEYRAKGEAAILRERGVAVAQTVQMMHDAWSVAGKSAMMAYLIDDIESILASAAQGVAKVKVGSVNVIDGGDGKALANYVGNYPAMLREVFSAVADTTGIDIPGTISGAKELPAPSAPAATAKGGETK